MILNTNINNALLSGYKINDDSHIDYVEDNVVYLKNPKFTGDSAVIVKDKELCKISKLISNPIIKCKESIIINMSRSNVSLGCIKEISSQGLWIKSGFSNKDTLNNLFVKDCYIFGIDPIKDCTFKMNNCNISTTHYVVNYTWRGTDKKLNIIKNNSKIIPKCVFFTHDNDCAFERINKLTDEINENLQILGLEHIDLDLLNCILIPNKYYNKVGVLYKENSMFDYSFNHNPSVEINAGKNSNSDWIFREFSFKHTYLDGMKEYSGYNKYLKWIEDLIL